MTSNVIFFNKNEGNLKKGLPSRSPSRRRPSSRRRATGRRAPSCRPRRRWSTRPASSPAPRRRPPAPAPTASTGSRPAAKKRESVPSPVWFFKILFSKIWKKIEKREKNGISKIDCSLRQLLHSSRMRRRYRRYFVISSTWPWNISFRFVISGTWKREKKHGYCGKITSRGLQTGGRRFDFNIRARFPFDEVRLTDD